MITHIFVPYTVISCTGGETEEVGPYATRTDEYSEYHKPEVAILLNSYSSLPLNGVRVLIEFNPVPYLHKIVYVIWVTYSTGDSFGNSFGNIAIPEIVEDELLANELVRRIKAKEYTDHAVWTGYFEFLEDVEAIPCILCDGRF